MMDTSYDDAPMAVLNWSEAGLGAALATVVQTWGSAPRPVGSQLGISEHADLVGSVSGGCVEGAVVAEALEAMEDGRPRLLEFGVSDEAAFAVGLACGGRITVLVEPMAKAGGGLNPALRALVAARTAGQPVAYVVDTVTGAARIAEPEAYPARFAADRSGFDEDARTFVTIHNPSLKMIIIGGVHIAQALAPMARLAGFDVTIVDPREAFASTARFGDIRLSHDWPDAALRDLGVDRRTAVVTLTHDPKLDDPALEVALQSQAFYIGSLGSSRTHAKRATRLTEAGFGASDIARIHGPVGLNIGARTPAEIAISIVGQITQVLRRP